MNRKEYENCFEAGRKTIGEHELLHALIFGNDDEYGDWDEVIFTVPEKWLRQHREEQTGEYWTSDRLREWLCEEYTSEDSSEIFDSALLAHQLVTMNIY